MYNYILLIVYSVWGIFPIEVVNKFLQIACKNQITNFTFNCINKNCNAVLMIFLCAWLTDRHQRVRELFVNKDLLSYVNCIDILSKHLQNCYFSFIEKEANCTNENSSHSFTDFLLVYHLTNTWHLVVTHVTPERTLEPS